MATERTLIIFKPDAVHRRLCGRLLTRIEERGLQLVGLKMLQVTRELAGEHYAEHVEKPFYPLLEEFITASPVVALVVQVIWSGQEVVGRTRTPDPKQASAALLAAAVPPSAVVTMN